MLTDGLLNTGLLSSQAEQQTGYITLEFDKDHYIHKVITYQLFYTHWYDPDYSCVADIPTYTSCIDSVSGYDVTVKQGEVEGVCGMVQVEVSHGPGQDEQVYEFLCGATGHVVELRKMGEIHVFEIVVVTTGKSLVT